MVVHTSRKVLYRVHCSKQQLCLLQGVVHQVLIALITSFRSPYAAMMASVADT